MTTLTDQLAPIYQQPLSVESVASAGPTGDWRRELETMLGLGVLVFENIRRRHLAWYADVESERTEYNVDDAQAFADEYRQWMVATERWLNQAEQLEQNGFEVARVDEIRQSYDQLRLVDLNIRELVKRYEKLEQGGGIEANEFFASLRNRESA